ncbi:DUF1684 domain-containing protein [Arthrobacter sp. NPDC090010]|uniref:DUF1684 domain-containing protein n=1 Tax=Arthrobacter sp. NPDC090010 TaxID=3363942 RepID=UPI00381ACE64
MSSNPIPSPPVTDPQLQRWQRFRDNRNAALASPHGWLTLTSFHWLPEQPSSLEGLPGLWWTDGVSAFVTVTAQDGLSMVADSDDGAAPPAVVGTVSAVVAPDDSLLWVQFGGDDGRQVAVELAVRGGRYAIRTRDDASPVYTGFSGVPVFDYRPELAVTAHYEPYPEPRDVPISTANPLVDAVHRSVGEVAFTLPGSETEYRLQAEEEKLGALVITFHDASNGESTDEWRKLATARPRPDGSVVLDFNRTINYPSAFTDFGTCPAPVPGNALPVPVEAGERKPR